MLYVCYELGLPLWCYLVTGLSIVTSFDRAVKRIRYRLMIASFVEGFRDGISGKEDK